MTSLDMIGTFTTMATVGSSIIGIVATIGALISQISFFILFTIYNL